MLILGWCDSQRDLEVVQKVVSQLCHAYEADGGRVIVVMTQRAKLELEALFRRILPPPQRYGSQLVFRQAGRPPAWQDLFLSWRTFGCRNCPLPIAFWWRYWVLVAAVSGLTLCHIPSRGGHMSRCMASLHWRLPQGA